MKDTTLAPHICAYVTSFGFVNPQGRPETPARGKPAPRPCRGGRGCRRAGGVSARSGAALRRCRGLRGAALPCRPRTGRAALLREGEEVPRWRTWTGRGTAPLCHGGRGSRRGAAARPAGTAGEEGREALEETPPAFIARTAPGCAGSRRRTGALSGDSDLQEPSLSCPSRLCPADRAPGLQPGPASPEVDSVLSALLPAAAPDLVQPGAGARNKPCPLWRASVQARLFPPTAAAQCSVPTGPSRRGGSSGSGCSSTSSCCPCPGRAHEAGPAVGGARREQRERRRERRREGREEGCCAGAADAAVRWHHSARRRRRSAARRGEEPPRRRGSEEEEEEGGRKEKEAAAAVRLRATVRAQTRLCRSRFGLRSRPAETRLPSSPPLGRGQPGGWALHGCDLPLSPRGGEEGNGRGG